MNLEMEVMRKTVKQRSIFFRAHKKSGFMLEADLHHFPLQRYSIIFES